mgnify:CR=1 FL=1
MVLEKLKSENVKIALVGASNDKGKFGNKIYLDLKLKGYDVIPINPKNMNEENELSNKNKTKTIKHESIYESKIINNSDKNEPELSKPPLSYP